MYEYIDGDQETSEGLLGQEVDILENYRLTTGDTDIWMMLLKYDGQFEPGDVCMVYYENSDTDVQQLMDILQLQDTALYIRPNQNFPVKLTLPSLFN